MIFLIPDTRERQRLELKYLRTNEDYYNTPPGPVREIIWHHRQAQRERLLEIENLEKWARS